MKRLAIVTITIVSLAAYAVADQINFTFTTGAPGSVSGSASGMAAGPSTLFKITNTTTSTIIPFAGTLVTIATGPATSFVAIGSPPTFISAKFAGMSTMSVEVVDSAMNPLVEGVLHNGASFTSALPAGTGAFLGSFKVTFVSPAVLAMFGLTGETVEPTGSVAYTTGNGNLAQNTTFMGQVGGGAVTIQTTAVPEPVGLGLLGAGILTALGVWRSRKEIHRTSDTIELISKGRGAFR